MYKWIKSNVQIVSVAGTRYLYENLSIFLFYMWLHVFIKDFKEDLYKIFVDSFNCIPEFYEKMWKNFNVDI